MRTWIIFLVFFLTSSLAVNAQRFISKSGFVKFYSYTPIEEIEGTNNVTASILDVSTGDIQVSMLIRSFSFKKKLMQEHFNENYMESELYPKSSFKGKISNIEQVDLKKDGTYKVDVEGNITIHGVTKSLKTQGIIEIQKGIPIAKAVFKVLTEDFKIEIPDLVKEKIAKEIEVSVDITYHKS